MGERDHGACGVQHVLHDSRPAPDGRGAGGHGAARLHARLATREPITARVTYMFYTVSGWLSG